MLKLLNKSSESSPGIIKSKVVEATRQENVDFVKLPSKTGIDSFSVNGETSTSFVSLSTVPRTTRLSIRCESSICQLSQSTKREVPNLYKEGKLCEHLSLFRDMYMKQVKEGIQIEDDMLECHDSEVAATLPEEKVLMFTRYYCTLLSRFTDKIFVRLVCIFEISRFFAIIFCDQFSHSIFSGLTCLIKRLVIGSFHQKV